MRRFKNNAIKFITYLMGVVFALSICAMDSKNLLIPIIAFLVSGAWLSLVAYANGLFYGTEPYYERIDEDDELDR